MMKTQELEDLLANEPPLGAGKTVDDDRLLKFVVGVEGGRWLGEIDTRADDGDEEQREHDDAQYPKTQVNHERARERERASEMIKAIC